MSSARRRPRPALQSWEKRGWVAVAYLDLYAHHAEFRRALLELYKGHCAANEHLLAGLLELWAVDRATRYAGDMSEWASSYLAALRDLAQRFGLDRLGELKAEPGEPPLPSGEDLIHAWCQFRAYLAQSSGSAWSPAMFAHGAGFGGPRPDVGELVRREAIPVRGPGGESVILLDERREPIVRVGIEDRWDPRGEPRAKARARLLAEAARQIDAELERIAADAEVRGYKFDDTAPKAREHLRWLFEHVALGKSYNQIARKHLGGWDQAPTVYNAIRPYADLLAIPIGRDR